MVKYINYLLLGFLLFIIGLISSGFELASWSYVNWTPEYINKTVDSFSIHVRDDAKYKIIKSKNNQNISIYLNENNNLKEDLYIEIEHAESSEAKTLIKNNGNNTSIVLSNDINLKKLNFKKINSFIMSCLKEKKVYNYNLLKYSKVYIYGNKNVLDRIEIVDND